MWCTDAYTVIVYLLRWALAVVSGIELATVWQALRSAATICSQGPLG